MEDLSDLDIPTVGQPLASGNQTSLAVKIWKIHPISIFLMNRSMISQPFCENLSIQLPTTILVKDPQYLYVFITWELSDSFRFKICLMMFDDCSQKVELLKPFCSVLFTPKSLGFMDVHPKQIVAHRFCSIYYIQYILFLGFWF